jgi:lipopolysaccharide transport system ATP-binding protein
MPPIIQVQDLSKSYTISHEGKESYTALRDVVVMKAKKIFSFPGKLTSTSKTKEEFWALKDISFEINSGDRVGIIGRNGAGKSTLLKILSRITEPTNGVIRIKGRVASLLEVGTGFHPELSGRENIFLNGAILGMSRAEIKRQFDAIVDFAEVEKFLDTPVKRYSSGMYVRLAFAVAAHLEPEILVVDEVLAVGDAQFQKKCLGKMEDVSKNAGRTVLFVSHNMTAMQGLCNQGILLEKGVMKFQGQIGDTITHYLRQFTETRRIVEWEIENAPGDEKTKFLKAEVNSLSKNKNIDFFEEGDSIEFNFVFWNSRETPSVFDITFHLVDELGNTVFVGSTAHGMFAGRSYDKGVINASCIVPSDLLHEGTYNISRLLLVQNGGTIALQVRDVIQFEVLNKQEERWGWMGAKEGVVKPKLEWKVQM